MLHLCTEDLTILEQWLSRKGELSLSTQESADLEAGLAAAFQQECERCGITVTQGNERCGLTKPAVMQLKQQWLKRNESDILSRIRSNIKIAKLL
jgi:hypothetical protein